TDAAGHARNRARAGQSLDLFENKLVELDDHLGTFLAMETGRLPLAIPPEKDGVEWAPYRSLAERDAKGHVVGTDPERPAAALLRIVREAYLSGQTERFNTALVDYKAKVTAALTPEVNSRVDLEL